jgi:hypothetical protein
MVSPKRYYTFMLEQELIDALKAAKNETHLSEGAQIRQALREWFSKQGVTVKTKTARKRAVTRKRA